MSRLADKLEQEQRERFAQFPDAAIDLQPAEVALTQAIAAMRAHEQAATDAENRLIDGTLDFHRTIGQLRDATDSITRIASPLMRTVPGMEQIYNLAHKAYFTAQVYTRGRT